jgi:hypothetical protein
MDAIYCGSLDWVYQMPLPVASDIFSIRDRPVCQMRTSDRPLPDGVVPLIQGKHGAQNMLAS